MSATTYDFGTVREGTRVEHNFPFSNRGQAPLEIKKVQAACGCTAAVPQSSIVQPGSSSELYASFDTTGFEGPKVKTIRVYTNDPNHPTALITMRGTVQTDVSVDPPRVFFGDVRRGTKQTAEVFVLGENGVSIELTQAGNPNLAAAASDAVKNGKKGKKLQITLLDTAPVGVFRDSVALKTSSGSRPTVLIPVTARIESELRTVPAYVSFDLMEGPLEKPVSKKIRIINNSREDIKILSVGSENSSFTADSKVVKPGKEFEVTVTAVTEAVGTIRSKIKIVTNYSVESEKTISLPVYGIFARKGE